MTQTNERPFVTRSINHPSDYTLPSADTAPPLIGDGDTDVKRHNLFEEGAPAHTRNYMVGLDVIAWKNKDGVERSHLIVDQKAGSLVLPWEASLDRGVWFFLQETYRGPHSKDPEVAVRQLLARDAFNALGVWSLEAPAGGIKHVNGIPVEAPVTAAVREVSEETGLQFEEDDLDTLLPGGLHIGGDINTKVSHLFSADINKGEYDSSKVSIEADEAVADLIAFRVRDDADLRELVKLTTLCASTTAAIALASLGSDIRQNLAS